MEFKKLLIEYYQKSLNEIDVQKLFSELLETDLINRGEFIKYVESSYYLNLLDSKEDSTLLRSYVSVIKDKETFDTFDKNDYLLMIYKTYEINSKSLSNFYA